MRATLHMVVSHIIKSKGDAGCVVQDIRDEIEKSHPHWKPTSVSATVSQLRDAGIVRIGVVENGSRRIYLARDFDPERDPKRINAVKEKLHPRKANGKHPPVVAPKMIFEVGSNQTMTLDFEEAKALYLQLDQIFGEK